MIYLASPYTHNDDRIMVARYDAACKAAGHLMGHGQHVFSPIAHTHPIAVRCELPRGWEYWQAFDEWMIRHCSLVVVLKLDGWDRSKGVAAELEIAKRLGVPVTYMEWTE